MPKHTAQIIPIEHARQASGEPISGTQGQGPRPMGLPRVYDPSMFVLPVTLCAVMFAAGFAAGAVWMGWWR